LYFLFLLLFLLFLYVYVHAVRLSLLFVKGGLTWLLEMLT